jgi:HEAT repeat protein
MGLFGPPDIEKLQAEGDVIRLSKALGYKQDNKIRLAAVAALAELGDTEAVEPLIATLSDPDVELRKAVITALGYLGDSRALEPLVMALADPSWSVYATAVDALGALGDPRAAPALIAAMGRSTVMVQLETSDALVRIGAPEEVLLEALAGDDVFVRRVAVRALGPLGDSRAVEPLISVLANTKSAILRGEAAEALGQIGGDQAILALVSVLHGKSSVVSTSAAVALKNLGWQPGKNAMAAAYWASTGAWDQCIELGELSIEPLAAILADPSGTCPEATLVAVVQTLGQIGGEGVLQPLSAALKDDYTEVRRAVVLALESLGGEQAVELLVGALEDRNLEMRQIVIAALGRLGGPRAIAALISRLDSPSDGWGVNAEMALLSIGRPTAEALIAALGDTNLSIQARLGAAVVLGQLGDPRAVAPLAAALEDLGAYYPRSILRALEGAHDLRALEPLVGILGPHTKELRRKAAHLLGELGDPQALPGLSAAQQDPDPLVREAAAKAAARLKKEPPATG